MKDWTLPGADETLHDVSSQTVISITKDNCLNQSVSLIELPPEIKEKIFIFASNEHLAYANREFHQISSSNLIRAHWLLQRYTPEKALALCWRWRFLRKLPSVIKQNETASTIKIERRNQIPKRNERLLGGWKVVSASQNRFRSKFRGKECRCQATAAMAEEIENKESWLMKVRRRWKFSASQTVAAIVGEYAIIQREDTATDDSSETVLQDRRTSAHFTSSCQIEQSQILIVLQLLDLGASITAGCDMALRTAARWGHLNLATILLQKGADPNAVVFFGNSFGSRWKKRKVGGGIPGERQHNIYRPPVAAANFQNQALAEEGLANGQLVSNNPQALAEAPVTMDTLRLLIKRPYQVSLLLQAVQANHTKLAKLLLTSSDRRPIAIRKNVVFAALKEALELERIEMCKLLVAHGGVRPSTEMVQNLVSRAGMWRLLCGMRNKLTPSICLAIENLSQDDFNFLSATLIRSAAEIGSVDFLKVCIARGGDVNIWNGHPLHASIYNGNYEITVHLLNPEVNVNTDNFGPRQKAFCVGLMIIEGFALLMFSLLLFLWIIALISYLEAYAAKYNYVPAKNSTMMDSNSIVNSSDTQIQNKWWSDSVHSKSEETGQDVTLGELSGMAVPSSVALFVMYRLVPLHKMCMSYAKVCQEQRRRKLLRRSRQQEIGAAP